MASIIQTESHASGPGGTLESTLNVPRPNSALPIAIAPLEDSAGLAPELNRRFAAASGGAQAALESSRVLQAQKLEALGALAAGIAHDLNNLLSVMLGFASLARQRLEPDHPLQDSMGMIEQSAQHAAELTRQLLNFARPEREQVGAVCVAEVLQRVKRIVSRTFDRKIRVVVTGEDAPLWVNAEPGLLFQAVLNLCINARDAMSRGGTLTIEAVGQSLEADDLDFPARCRPGRYAGIAVQDTGTGIDPTILARVFEPFFTTKEPGHGTGLGLAMVYSFAQKQGGYVSVQSEPGHGARFTIYLPLVAAPGSRPRSPRVPKLQAGRGTVLVVDDEPLVRAFASEGLKRLGYRVRIAENGLQALELYTHHQGEIDCVLLDLIMPELGGLETFHRLREINPNVRVVFASGYNTGEMLNKSAEARRAEFIGKPYSLEALSQALRQTVTVASADTDPAGGEGSGPSPCSRPERGPAS